ncbi:O-fucosyltransferase 9 isoform X5 [Zea mays]|uniref:O-fucosyltransferase family protein n=1 Tax=Zea mays TaxID=4577 RepID=A0A804MJR0_MAIZE|nr:O-fucosyltransferase 9 isoform X5 [Zea mays]
MQVAAAAASMRGTETVGAKSAARRLSRVLVGRRRRAAVLLLALAYAAAMLMLTIGGSEGSGSSGVVAGVLRRGAQSAPPGSVYRSHLVFERLLPEMRAFASRPNPICDAIAVAKILNATLVTPAFHLNSVWRDSSKFGDIFDEDHFIESLRKYVRVVKDLPEDVFLRFNHNISIIPNMRTKAFSPPSYYLQHVLPKLLELGAVRIAPFSNRLAHSVPMNIQALRCLTNYKALRFSEPIRILADNMVDRMIKRSFLSGGKYVSVHLRFEEVGMMLRGMGFDNTTSLYVASGKIYNAEKYMTPLRRLFPFLQTKHALVTPEELAQFKGHSSRLAALDYTICLHSEVFVMTQGSNFPHFLMGHRRYMYGGHAKTIKPDKRKLVQLFDNPNIRWDRFKHHMQDMRRHSEMKGFALRKPQESIYTLPMPDCMCQQAEARSRDTARS